jgi:hypothetical protein
MQARLPLGDLYKAREAHPMFQNSADTAASTPTDDNSPPGGLPDGCSVVVHAATSRLQSQQPPQRRIRR